MAILAFDTTTDNCSVACLYNGKIVQQSQQTRSGRGAPQGESMAAVLIPMLQNCLTQHGISFSDVETMMLPRGPGSFTGIRIGFSVMHGLLIANPYKVMAPTIFDIWASAHQQRLLMLLDNKQGRFYAATATAGQVDYADAGIMSLAEAESIAHKYDLVLTDQEISCAKVPETTTARLMLNMVDMLETSDGLGLQPYYLHNPAFKKL